MIKIKVLLKKKDYIYKKELLVKYKEKLYQKFIIQIISMNNIINSHNNKKENTKINEIKIFIK